MASRKSRTRRRTGGFEGKRAQTGVGSPRHPQDSDEATLPDVARNVDPRLHDEARAGERPIMRHLAIVAAQTGRDFQLD